MESKIPSSMPVTKITWDQYDKDVHKLAEGIKSSGVELHCIYAIPRGAYIMGVHLSHLLKLPLVDKPYGTTLVVDEISDTGSTLSGYKKQRMKRVYTATLHIKEGTKTVPDFWVAKYVKNTWIQYPWEV